MNVTVIFIITFIVSFVLIQAQPAQNMLKSETYRKWRCAAGGEKQASVILEVYKCIAEILGTTNLTKEITLTEMLSEVALLDFFKFTNN